MAMKKALSLALKKSCNSIPLPLNQKIERENAISLQSFLNDINSGTKEKNQWS